MGQKAQVVISNTSLNEDDGMGALSLRDPPHLGPRPPIIFLAYEKFNLSIAKKLLA